MEGFVLVSFMFVSMIMLVILGLAFAYGLAKESHIFSPPNTPRPHK